MLKNNMHPNTKAMLLAWKRITAAPYDIEGGPYADEYPSLLGRLFVIETARKDFAPFRIAGDELTEILGRNIIGTDFLDLWRGADRSLISALLESVAYADKPGMVRAIGQTSTGRRTEVELAIAPLGQQTTSPNRMLCLYQTLGGENMLQNRSIWSHKIRSIYPPAPTLQANNLRLVASND